MKSFAFTFLFLLGCFRVVGQCPLGGITFTRQGQIDSFAILYPGCTEVLGSITIGNINSTNNYSITNLNGLATVISIGGDLNIEYCGNLANLDGLTAVTSIGGDLYIENCGNLANLDGLTAVTSIGGDLQITVCNSLENINGLQAISSIGEILSISNCNNLTNIIGLQSITSIGALYVTSCNNLTNFNGLQAITSIGGDLSINGCSSLTDISSLQSITSIGGDLRLSTNNILADLNGLQSITSIGGDLSIYGCSSLTDISSLQSITSIGGDLSLNNCNNLANLNGLQAVNSIGGTLSISYCIGLTDISSLHSITSIGGHLIFEWCNNLANLNGLTAVTSIGGDLQILFCNSLENLNGLQAITSIGERLTINSCYNLINFYGLQAISSIGLDLSIGGCNNLVSLNGLQAINSIGGDFNITNCNSLTNLTGFPSTTSIGGSISISSCNSLENLNGLQTITSIGEDLSIYDCDALTNTDNLQYVTSIGEDLHISYCDNLANLNGLQSVYSIGGDFSIIYCNVLLNLGGLSTLNSVGGDFEIRNNPQLSSCAVIALCNKLVTSPSSVTIANNNSGCDSKAEILQNCASLSNATGKVYLDLNCNNTFEATDQVAPQALLRREADNIPITSTNDTGFYKVYSLPLTTTTYTIDAPLGFTAHPDSYTISTDTTFQQFPNKDFRLCPDSLFHNLKTTLTSVTVPRPGFTNQYQVCVMNLGTQSENATLTLDFSTGVGAQYITITNAAGGTVQNNSITWNINNLQVFDSKCFTVTIQLATNTPLGIYLQPTANVSLTPAQTETILSDNLVALNDLVVGSYDPNDKTVDMPNITYDPTSGVTRLQYKIRFQNTGTFPATFIEVLDTLESKLDIRTIEMVAASHDYTLSFPSPNVLKWRFNDINLPDSTSNEAGSHGFVVFNISTKTPINLGEMVQNRAGIYFDFNEPVITNYATTSFTVGVHDPLGLGSLPLSIAPNPTSDNITLRYSLTESADSELLITNAQGVVVQSQRLGKQGLGDYALPVSLGGLPAGLYLVTVRAGGLVGVGKVVRL